MKTDVAAEADVAGKATSTEASSVNTNIARTRRVRVAKLTIPLLSLVPRWSLVANNHDLDRSLKPTPA